MDSKWPKAHTLLKQFATFGRNRGPLFDGCGLCVGLRQPSIRIRYDAMILTRIRVNSKARDLPSGIDAEAVQNKETFAAR